MRLLISILLFQILLFSVNIGAQSRIDHIDFFEGSNTKTATTLAIDSQSTSVSGIVNTGAINNTYSLISKDSITLHRKLRFGLGVFGGMSNYFTTSNAFSTQTQIGKD
jgi:hypothetical protein